MTEELIKEKTVLTLDTLLVDRSTQEQWNAFFEGAVRILQGKNPTWRVERDASMRAWHIVMTCDEDSDDIFNYPSQDQAVHVEPVGPMEVTLGPESRQR
tara:strand:+ start:166 stop:462 length:297 start_codon:yes stop_codon:yes gene_type:complete